METTSTTSLDQQIDAMKQRAAQEAEAAQPEYLRLAADATARAPMGETYQSYGEINDAGALRIKKALADALKKHEAAHRLDEIKARTGLVDGEMVLAVDVLTHIDRPSLEMPGIMSWGECKRVNLALVDGVAVFLAMELEARRRVDVMEAEARADVAERQRQIRERAEERQHRERTARRSKVTEKLSPLQRAALVAANRVNDGAARLALVELAKVLGADAGGHVPYLADDLEDLMLDLAKVGVVERCTLANDRAADGRK